MGPQRASASDMSQSGSVLGGEVLCTDCPAVVTVQCFPSVASFNLVDRDERGNQEAAMTASGIKMTHSYFGRVQKKSIPSFRTSSTFQQLSTQSSSWLSHSSHHHHHLLASPATSTPTPTPPNLAHRPPPHHPPHPLKLPSLLRLHLSSARQPHPLQD